MTEKAGWIGFALGVLIGMIVVLALVRINAPQSSDTVFVDTDYCTPVDGGLLCTIDPEAL